MTKTDIMKDFLKKAVLPVVVALFLYSIFSRIFVDNGTMDLFLIWLACGVPFGIGKMFTLIPIGFGISGTVGVVALNIVLGGLIGGVILIYRLAVAVWYLPLTIYRLATDVLSFPGSIDVVSVGEIKLTIIVLGIVDTIFSGTAVVPCHFQFTSSPPTIEKRAAKRANPVPIATGNTQYDMTQASYHWARASALNLMGLAALNLPKGIASP